MDSVRAGNVSAYSHENETTPFLRSFSETATVYEKARSPGTWSLPSHVSLFTGYHVKEHGITRAKHRLQAGHSIFEKLGENHEYATGVFSENTWLTDMEVGLKDGFDTVEGARNLPYPEGLDPSNFVLSEGQGLYLKYLKTCLQSEYPIKSIANGLITKLAWDYPRFLPDSLSTSTPADVYADLFLDWAADTDGPWAACVNFMDAHLPYDPTPEHDRWGGNQLRELQDEMDDQVWEFHGSQRPWWQRKALEGLYDGTIHQIDAQIRRIIEELRQRGELDNTLVVITSDHGEGFGEVSRVRPDTRVAAHGSGIHESQLHVPLIIQTPGQSSPETVEEVATLSRFPEAVRAAIGGDIKPDVFVPEGPVLASSHGLEEPMEERARRYCGDISRFNGEMLAVYHDEGELTRKYVTWRDREACIAIGDPNASFQTHGSARKVVEESFETITDVGVREDTEGVDDLDEATKQRLEQLGYA